MSDLYASVVVHCDVILCLLLCIARVVMYVVVIHCDLCVFLLCVARLFFVLFVVHFDYHLFYFVRFEAVSCVVVVHCDSFFIFVIVCAPILYLLLSTAICLPFTLRCYFVFFCGPRTALFLRIVCMLCAAVLFFVVVPCDSLLCIFWCNARLFCVLCFFVLVHCDSILCFFVRCVVILCFSVVHYNSI